jgi:putative ABC transport system permease protein
MKSNSLRFLKWFCPPHLYEEIEGDIIQKFNQDVKSYGERKAKSRLLWNVIRFFRPGILLRNKFSTKQKPTMISNYFQFSWRSIGRNKVFSFINVAGLALGMTVCLLILNYVLFERSYDKSNARYQDIVRISYTRLLDNEVQFSKAQVFPAVAEALKAAIPEVENTVRIFPIGTQVEPIFWTEEDNQRKSFVETSVYAVDSSFLQVFSLPLIHGNSAAALSGDNKVIISESTAKKYFGEANALNKVFHWDGMGDYVVTGVFADRPENSHMQFDFLTSWMNVYEERHAFRWDGFYTYLLLSPNTSPKKVESLMQQVLDEKMRSQENDERVSSKFFLQPLEEIHLQSQLSGEFQPNGNAKLVNVLLWVALIILALAVINYLNLSVARAVKRSKEVGVRKIIGSSRHQLKLLFFTESFTLNSVAFILAIVFTLSLNPLFNSLAGKEVGWMIWEQPVHFVIVAFAALILFSLLSGFYPAWLLSSFNPVVVMKSSGHSFMSGRLVRKSLLMVQFLITIVLVTGTLIIERQVSFMQSQDLGFNLHQNVVIKSLAPAGGEVDSLFRIKMDQFKNKVKENAQVVNATISSNIPGRENEWIGKLSRTEQDKELISIYRTRVDKDFIETYGLRLITGRNFSDENPNQIILNQSAVKMLGFKSNEEALGHLLMKDNEIIGVVNDFHERSLHEAIKPAMYIPGRGHMKFITVHLRTEELSQSLHLLQRQWKAVFPDQPFDFFLLDEFFNRQYRQELQLEKVFKYFSAIGIGIACLGLFGFTYFMTLQRTKEIGIRKTLGASMLNLIRLLSSEFALLLMLSGLVAAPISYYLVTNWLSRYPIKIEPGLEHFILPVLGIAVTAFISVIILLVKAARTNPTEALKYE